MVNRLAWFVVLVLCGGAALSAQPQRSASEDDVFALKEQVHAGSRQAMRRLLALETDGAVAEYADIIMGGAIRNHPMAFLEVVAEAPEAQCEGCLDGMLGNLGDDFVDKSRKQVEELSKRRTALRSVNVAALRPIRDKCINILDGQIKQIQSLIDQGIE